MPKPWDRPTPAPTEGGASEAALFAAIGRALTRWQMIEDDLVQLFRYTLQVDVETAYVIYANVPSISGKIAMMRKVGEHAFRDAPEHHAYYEDLLKLVEAIGDRRNDIAHGIVKSDRHGGFLLYATQAAARGFDFKSWTRKYAFREDHVDRYAAVFSALQREIELAPGAIVRGAHSRNIAANTALATSSENSGHSP